MTEANISSARNVRRATILKMLWGSTFGAWSHRGSCIDGAIHVDVNTSIELERYVKNNVEKSISISSRTMCHTTYSVNISAEGSCPPGLLIFEMRFAPFRLLRRARSLPHFLSRARIYLWSSLHSLLDLQNPRLATFGDVVSRSVWSIQCKRPRGSGDRRE
jgi:hypothetical protein